MKREAWLKSLLALAAAALTVAGGIPLYRHRHAAMTVVAGPGVTAVEKLSAYAPGIAGTLADTPVFVLRGREPGGAAFIMGDTHANEPEGLLASLIVIENAVVAKGTLYVVPVFNSSASRNTRPGDGYPLYVSIPTAWGAKRLRFGNRDASPIDQWPDPDVYIHYPDRQLLSYIDARNTNRTWPGRPDGLLMERVTAGAMDLLRRNAVDVAIDLHGAETMFPVTNCIVAPEKSQRIATMASLTVKAAEGFDSHVEPSPAGFRGLSHREIGDYSDTLPFLLESPIPFLDQPTGPKTEQFFHDGKDPFLLSLAGRKRLFVPYDASGWPLEKRVGQHLSTMLEILKQFSRKNAGRAVVCGGIPRYADVVKNGVGRYLHDPAAAEPKSVVKI